MMGVYKIGSKGGIVRNYFCVLEQVIHLILTKSQKAEVMYRSWGKQVLLSIFRTAQLGKVPH
jgi:hypothetical protein